MSRKSKANRGETNRGRRRLLRVLSIGGVATAASNLPENWSKPVVDQVLLPAHAQMSPGTGPGADDVIGDLTDDIPDGVGPM